MNSLERVKVAFEILAGFLHQPRLCCHLLHKLPSNLRSVEFAKKWESSAGDLPSHNCSEDESLVGSSNPLESYFNSHNKGRGIWKWMHYFEVYHQHFRKFRGREVHILEIGIYSGGSLEMWKDYFGPKCHVYGVDIEEACKVYENDYTKVFIGDQADREFWKHLRKQVPAVDILVDDGGHAPEQQIVTLEEMLPHLRRGGVYLCEDVHGDLNRFASYVHGLAYNLNAADWTPQPADKGQIGCNSTAFQNAIRSIHLYPFVIVIEKADRPVIQFIAPKHGTSWQPFL